LHGIAPARERVVPVVREAFRGAALQGDPRDEELAVGVVALPQARWVFDDYFLVRKERGSYVTAVDASGNHGDSFDSGKLALYALQNTGGFYAQNI
jgi:hypothetical protein